MIRFHLKKGVGGLKKDSHHLIMVTKRGGELITFGDGKKREGGGIGCEGGRILPRSQPTKKGSTAAAALAPSHPREKTGQPTKESVLFQPTRHRGMGLGDKPPP